MKGVLLAVTVSISMFVAICWVLRERPHWSRLSVFAAIYSLSASVLLILYLAAPDDLGFLPPSLLGTPAWLDLTLSMFALSASFFGGWLQLFNLAERGYSLRLLIDLLECSNQPLSADDIATRYAGGLGLEWMYRRRLDGLLALGCIAEQSGMVITTARGQRLALLFRRLRQLYRVGEIR